MSNKKNNSKKPYLSDKPIQGGLCIRVAIYWIASQVVTLCVVSGMFYLETGSFEGSFRFIIPALIAGIIALPLAINDVLSFSNRFAGALLNFRRKFHKLSLGEPSEKLVLRNDDFLQDLSEDYNRLRQRIQGEDASVEEQDLQEVCN